MTHKKLFYEKYGFIKNMVARTGPKKSGPRTGGSGNHDQKSKFLQTTHVILWMMKSMMPNQMTPLNFMSREMSHMVWLIPRPQSLESRHIVQGVFDIYRSFKI